MKAKPEFDIVPAKLPPVGWGPFPWFSSGDFSKLPPRTSAKEGRTTI